MNHLLLFGLCIACASALAIPEFFHDALIHLSKTIKPSELHDEGLVQVEKTVDNAGCALGHFWCESLKDVGMSQYNQSRLTIQRGHDNTYSEWYYNGKPTCVASGLYWHTCDPGEAQLLVCGGGTTYGTGSEQAKSVVAAMENGGVHPDCPGCAVGRNMPHSVTTCMVPKGEACEYFCDETYLPTGKRVCNATTGEMSGGGCKIPAVDVDATEIISSSPMPSPSISPSPSVVFETKADVSHENWTAYQEHLDQDLSVYQERIAEDVCLYLLDLENHWHELGLMPRYPLRSKLYDAARAADCAWVHEESRVDHQENPHYIPVRGDHGPWPTFALPNVVHVRTPSGIYGLDLDLSKQTGTDLYKDLAHRMGIAVHQLTVYSPDGVTPIDEQVPLSRYNIKYSDILQGTWANRVLGSNQNQQLWHPSVHVDGDIGPLAPDV